MNKFICVCTLGADPTVKTYGDGKTLVSFSGAVQKRFTKEGEDSTDWFKFTAFNSTADFIAKYFKKGSKMLVEGELHNNNYEKDSVKHYGVQVTVNNVEFYGKKSDGEVSDKSTQKADSAGEAVPYDEYDDF